jgi:hypothetical protein
MTCSGHICCEVCSAVKRLLTVLFRLQALASIEIAHSDAMGQMQMDGLKGNLYVDTRMNASPENWNAMWAFYKELVARKVTFCLETSTEQVQPLLTDISRAEAKLSYPYRVG